MLAPDTITLHALSKGRNTTQTDLTDDVATYLDSTRVGRDMGIELLQTMREKSAELGEPWEADFNAFLTGLRRRYAERHVILRRLDEVFLIS